MNVEKSAKDVAMSDVALAADRIRQVAGMRGSDEPVKVLLERAYQTLARINPEWSRRRVRALWRREAARIDYREIAEMERAISEARKRHAAYEEQTAQIRAYTARLLAPLEPQDPDFYRGQVEGVGEFVRVLDMPGDAGGDE